MQTLLNLLASVALLVWGRHIVRTGILRVYGGSLRRVRAKGVVKSAQRLLAEKERFRDLERHYHDTHLDRLAGQSPQAIETSSLHLDIISDMRRVNSFFCSTAYPILESAGRLRKSRLVSGATGLYEARPDLAVPPAKPAPH